MSALRAAAALAAVMALASGCMDSGGSSGPLERRLQQDGVELVVSVDRSVARIAEPVAVTVEVDADESRNISPPDPVADENGFVAVDIGDTESAVVNGQRTQRRALTFESYTAGRIAIPAFVVKYSTAGASTSAPPSLAIRSEPLSVRVLSSAGFFADPRAFRDNVNVVDPPHGWLYWTIVGCFTLAGIAALIRVVISLARRMAAPRTAGDLALHELKSIERRGLREQWSASKIIAEADAVLRVFLQQSWRLPDSQLTAQELAWAAEAQNDLSHNERAAIQELLQVADQWKFARLRVTPVDAARAIAGIRELIVEMTQPPTSGSQSAMLEATRHV